MKAQQNQVLKLSTSGSVDDGKSTLIGRLLYETNSLEDDKLAKIEQRSKEKGVEYLDFSLATDGLVAEREQGITIDVAHIYFSTANRSYIIADTPGHIEYTRNMVTGTSTSQVSIILIDARKGVIEQTKRHFFIANLMRVKEVVVAVNKMDLVEYYEETFRQIVRDFELLQEKASFKGQKITFIPISALVGDNITRLSANMPWYSGETVLEYLEQITLADVQETAKARFQVQTVIRPKRAKFHDFRGYAGKLKGADLKVGDTVTVVPSGQTSSVKSILFYDEEFEAASKGSSITITLTDDINVARGDMIVKTDEVPNNAKQLTAKMCWMDQQPLLPGTMYFLQHGVNKVKTKVKAIHSKLDSVAFDAVPETNQLTMNDLGEIELQLAKPLFFDAFEENKENGSFILIDTKSNTTAGVGFFE